MKKENHLYPEITAQKNGFAMQSMEAYFDSGSKKNEAFLTTVQLFFTHSVETLTHPSRGFHKFQWKKGG